MKYIFGGTHIEQKNTKEQTEVNINLTIWLKIHLFLALQTHHQIFRCTKFSVSYTVLSPFDGSTPKRWR